MPESDDKYNPGWQNMDDVARSGRATMTVDRGVDPNISIIDALERCFKVADDISEISGRLEERLGFILAGDVDSLEKSPSESLDEEGARAPMIGRLHDLERRLRITRNHLARTSERIAI